MSTIQVRIDEKTKKDSKKILDNLGIDMSTAIKVYLKQIVITRGIPFQLLTENGLTVQEEKKILRASFEASSGKNISKIMDTREAIDYLNSL
ncbi:type II toxin-antitoxin system RelB/DinJ family antitoxin [Candidatus Peregrinibacteria bacterium]|nr:type II toxin-antitoxin system RelB/DinJ family antitoxin [Candidatus Peregrinibacteria bacterium]